MILIRPICNSIAYLYQLKLRIALLVLVLPLAIVLSYLAASWLDLLQYKHYIEKITGQQHVSKLITLDRFRLALRQRLQTDFNGWIGAPPSIHDSSALKSYYLYVDPEDLSQLNSDLPDSGREYISGYMLTSEQQRIQKMKIRYRGTIPTHWAFRQKSLRIKMAKGELNQMDREFNLINPPHRFFPIDYVSYDISREAGLLAPDSEPVRVFINNEYMGVYSYLSQVDESTLRKNRRMPGSIYYGETAKYIDEQGVNVLWKHAPSWRKQASRNLEENAYRGDIDALVSAVNTTDPVEFYRFFNRHTDKAKFYTFFGIDTLVGGMHHDYSHNHRIYFSPYKGRFEPVQWDVRFWLPVHAKDAVTYPLLTRVMLNPILEMERDLAGYRLLNSFPQTEIIKRLRHYQHILQDELKSDVYRDDAVFYGPHYFALPFSLKQFNDSLMQHEEVIRERARVLEASYQHTEANYRLRQLDPSAVHLQFQVSGNSPVTLDLAEYFPQRTGQFAVYQDRNGNRQADEDERVTSSVQVIQPGRKILPGNETWGNPGNRGRIKLRPSPLNYDFIVKNGGDPPVDTLRAINTITAAEVEIHDRAAEPTTSTASIHPWSLPRLVPGKISLNGIIDIDEDRVYEVGSDVVIEPGTVFRLAAGKSIFFYGRVRAVGSSDRPIHFQARDAAQPWGSIVIQGKGSSGSELAHVRISNGSTSRFRLVNYPGQLNIHHSDDFRLSHCEIGRNHIGDDNVHIANSNAVIDDCVFYQSARDALDVDISSVEISNSRFLVSGNDSLDFMTTEFEVSNNIFYRAGDKCLSVGEWSQGVLSNNLLMNCLSGIAVKDKSRVSSTNMIIENAGSVAVSLYRKNYRYDEGGKLDAEELYLLGNETIEQDEYSEYSIESPMLENSKVNNFAFLPSGLKSMRQWDQLRDQLEAMSNEY